MRLFKVILPILLVLTSFGSVFADTTDSQSPELLPDRIGKFRRVAQPTDASSPKPGLFGGDFDDSEQADYVGTNGARVTVEAIHFTQDDYAYEFLSLKAMRARQEQPDLQIRAAFGGVAGFVSDREIAFARGRHFVGFRPQKPLDEATRDALVAELSERFERGENDIPAVIKHLPNPDEAHKQAVYLHNFFDLNLLNVQQSVFSAIDAQRNADAVVATYGSSEVVIIEFNTPQLATENDQKIIAQIQDLWKRGLPAPTAYRRVGNYSVFVFDAPDEQTARQLIDQVKYEQVVQWLGENPNIYKEAEKRYINTTLGVLVAVIKASGYALVLCLGAGALVGGLLFTYRRSQQKAVVFSDAGGMLRLNLDELTAETDPSRLLRERN